MLKTRLYKWLRNWWSYLQKKKRGKNASFFVNPIVQVSKKNDELENVEKTHKSPESPKAIKKLDCFAHQECFALLEILKHNTKCVHNKYTSALSKR